jgi:putative redox protein
MFVWSGRILREINMAKILEATLEQVGPTTSKATVRSHTVFVDRPTERGGADKGPVGGEYQLVALGGCFTSHLLAAIRAREPQTTPITDVKVAATGTLDGNPERFTEFTLTVSAKCDDPALLQKVVTIAERACQVVNTLKQSTPVTVTVQETAQPVRS